MLTRFLYFILISFSPLLAKGDTILSGSVTNDIGEPLRTVMVKAITEDGKSWHTKTGKDGNFYLSIPEESTPAIISFNKLGYEPESINLTDVSGPVLIKLHRTSTILKEVTVKAPSVRLRGDTVVYNLADFAGKGDVSLQDALKKVPGVEVGNDGGIKYNGKNISNFYINGIDLLGGKYNIATTSIPHSYVSAVEILNNHQNKKIDRSVFSDNVAMNIRLKSKAMFKPMGKYDVKAATGDRLMGEATGAGMMFAEKFQTILTLKGGNINEFAAYDNVIHYSYENLTSANNYAESILGNLSASTPPLGRNRWIRPIDTSATFNLINKISGDATIRTDIAYEFTHTDYDYSESASYFGGDHDVEINTSRAPSANTHKPSFSIEYRLDSDRRYIRNNLKGEASFSAYGLPVNSGNNLISQAQDMKSFNISEDLGISWKKGKIKWNAASFVQFRANPEGRIVVAGGENPEAKMTQTARTYSLRLSQDVSGAMEYRRSRIYFPANISFSHDRIYTVLSDRGYGDENINARNNLTGSELRLSLSPSYEYSSRYNRLVLRAGIPFSINIHDRKNIGTIYSSDNNTYLNLSPSVYLNYDATSKSTFGASAVYKDSHGDILDLLTSPVMTDYMSMQLKSGIISHNRQFNSSLRYSFKSPLSMWNFRITADYTKGWNNLMPGQYVTSGLIAVTNYLSPSSFDSFNSYLTLSKQFREIRTKITLNGAWSVSRNQIEQNGMRVKYHGNTFSFTPWLTTNPFGWFELNYNLNLSLTSTRFRSIRRSYSSQSHDIGVKFYLGEKWELNMKSDITRKEILKNSYKTMSLFDAGAVYKFKSFRLGLEMHNILDCKNYSYTIFNGLDCFSYSYALRGRELVVSFTFIK